MEHREVGLTYRWKGEGDPPGEGDVLISTGGSHYLIVEARKIKVRDPDDQPKIRLRCQVIDVLEVPSDAGVFDLLWDRRTLKSLTCEL